MKQILDEFNEMLIRRFGEYEFITYDSGYNEKKEDRDVFYTFGSTRLNICFEENLKYDPYLLIPFYFTKLESYIYQRYPKSVKTSNFYEIYNAIIIKENKDIIVKYVFRVMKLLRNALVHRKLIYENNSVLKANYKYNKHKKTPYELEMSSESLVEMYKLINGLMQYNIEQRGKKFYLSALSWSYNKLIEAVHIKDEFSDPIKPIENTLLFNPDRFVFTENVDFTIKDNQLFIEPFDNMKKAGTRGADYRILYEDNYYVIPTEVLGESYEIELDELCEWACDKELW